MSPTRTTIYALTEGQKQLLESAILEAVGRSGLGITDIRQFTDAIYAGDAVPKIFGTQMPRQYRLAALDMIIQQLIDTEQL